MDKAQTRERQFKSDLCDYWDILGQSAVACNCLHKWTLIFNLGLEFKYSFADTVDEIFYKTFKYACFNKQTMESR